MEAKEKAKELVGKFASYAYCSDGNNSMERQYQRQDNAKYIAKIAVNETIEAFKELSIMESGSVKIDFGHGYWESVLKEIDNI